MVTGAAAEKKALADARRILSQQPAHARFWSKSDIAFCTARVLAFSRLSAFGGKADICWRLMLPAGNAIDGSAVGK